MSFEDNIIHGRSSGPGFVRPIQLVTPRTAGGTASALPSYDSVLKAQRLYHNPSQPPNALKNYRELSPPSLFPHEEERAGPLQNRLYDAGSPVLEPLVRQHQYAGEGIPEGNGFSVTLEETRIDPPRVEHTDSDEQAIKAQERHIQSMIRHYCGDSKETQLRALKLVLEHGGQICRIERRTRAGAPSGGVQSLKTNAVRTFAEHLTHKHLHIPNPFVCFAAACGKVFPYSQDRDRHEKWIHKMYRPKAYQTLLKNRAREQSGLPPVRTDNPQSPTEFVAYVGPAQANPRQTVNPGAHPHHSILPSSKRPTAPLRSPKVDNGVLRSKTLAENHRAGPYMLGYARSRSSPARQYRKGSRNVSHSIPSNNSIHREADDRGRPIMTGPKSHIFPASSQACAPSDGMQGSVDGPMEGYYAPGETQIQMPHGHWSVPATMSQPGSNMISNPPLIDSMRASSIGYQGPSTSVYAVNASLQLGNPATMGPVYEQPNEGPPYYGSTPSGMQSRMPPFNMHTPHQHDGSGIYGSTQLQPSHHRYGGQTMYQAQSQQPLQDGSPFYGSFYQNMPTSSSPWSGPQNSTTATPYTTPQMPGHGASSYTAYPPSGGSHVTNPNGLNDQLYYDFLRPFTPNSGSDYNAHGGAGTSQYNQF